MKAPELGFNKNFQHSKTQSASTFDCFFSADLSRELIKLHQHCKVLKVEDTETLMLLPE